jgi:hypothetical protein
MRFLNVPLFALATLVVSKAALADEPVRQVHHDPGAYPPPAARWNMVGAGAATTAVWYGAALGFSYWFPDAPGADDLRIPVAGPWMALADTGCAEDDPDCSIFIVILRAVLTTVDGVGQAGGVLVIAESLFLTTQTFAPRPRASRALELRPVPLVTGKDGVGFGVIGRF